MAMGVTQTAACHSISYPFTSRYDLPHGIACSFTLAEMASYIGETCPDRIALIGEAMDCPGDQVAPRLRDLLHRFELCAILGEYLTPNVVDGFGDNLITRARAANNARPIDGATALEIARTSLNDLMG